MAIIELYLLVFGDIVNYSGDVKSRRIVSVRSLKLRVINCKFSHERIKLIFLSIYTVRQTY